MEISGSAFLPQAGFAKLQDRLEGLGLVVAHDICFATCTAVHKRGVRLLDIHTKPGMPQSPSIRLDADLYEAIALLLTKRLDTKCRRVRMGAYHGYWIARLSRSQRCDSLGTA